MPRGGGAEPHSALQTSAEGSWRPVSPARRANGRWRASLRPNGLLHDRDALVVERPPALVEEALLGQGLCGDDAYRLAVTSGAGQAGERPGRETGVGIKMRPGEL